MPFDLKDINVIAVKAQSAAQSLHSNTVKIVYEEMKRCEEEKNDITNVFYGKVNILLTISSIILSGNMLLLTYFIQNYDFSNSYFGLIAYILSSIFILYVLHILIRNMRFKKSYLEVNELKYVEKTSKQLTEENLMRTQIAAIITKNYTRNKNIEEMKSNMKQVTLFLNLSILLMVLSSAYIWIFDHKEHNAIEVSKMPVMELIYKDFSKFEKKD